MVKETPAKTAKKAAQTPQTAPQEPVTAAKKRVGRPPLGKQKRANMCLTVSQEERLALEFVSRHKGQSVSELIGAWGLREAKKISKQTGKPLPEPDQLTIPNTK